MVIDMKDSELLVSGGIEGLRRFLRESAHIRFRRHSRSETYDWIERVLREFEYADLSKKDKGTLKEYLEKMSGYSRAQITRLIKKYQDTGKVVIEEYERHKFERKYCGSDIRLLAETSEKHNHPNGASLKAILGRMCKKYGCREYADLSGISVSHIYNLRQSVTYKRAVLHFDETKKSKTPQIGDRRKPEPGKRPGFIRVDTVHQGDDSSKGKGVYHINSVDEVLQWEVVGSVKTLKRRDLLPMLSKMLSSYPFEIINFHADNGSEYINKHVADLLNELLISLTKSRPRHSNDNALAETKNGWVVRKQIGYGYIDGEYADEINDFYFGCFNEYLNYHRPCAFPTIVTDKKGKEVRKYFHEDYKTPYEKFKSLPDAEKYLRDGLTFEKLDSIESRYTDNEMAEIVQKKREELFATIKKAA